MDSLKNVADGQIYLYIQDMSLKQLHLSLQIFIFQKVH